MSERPPDDSGEVLANHRHFYRWDISDWWCENEQVVTDFCSEINGLGQGGDDA